MKFSYNLIKKYVDISMAPQELADMLTLKTAEVEEVTPHGDDFILEIKILPSRADLLSHYGMAREVAAITGSQFRHIAFEARPSEPTEQPQFSVTIKNKACRRYCGLLVDNVRVGPSPQWLQDFLTGMGQRPINNIVDITNYLMFELGQPLHAFDSDKIDDHEIIVRKPRKNESITILDEARTQYSLNAEAIVIADAKKALAIGGIKGGADTAIDEQTARIVVEAANFDKSTIRRTAMALRLHTDASLRFSYGLDPNMADVALHRAAQLLQDHAGATVQRMIDVYPKPLKSWRLRVNPKYIRSLLGVEVTDEQMRGMFESLGIEIDSTKRPFVLMIPTYRYDIQTQEDIAEEVARLYGYERLPSVPPVFPAYVPFSPERSDVWEMHEYLKARELMRDILKGLGFSETYSYSFLGDEAKEAFDLKDMPEVLNPLSHHYRYVRPSLIPGLVIALYKNLRFFNTPRLFEVGNVFAQKGDDIFEREQLAGAFAATDAFPEAKGIVETLLRQLGVDDAEFVPPADEYSGRHWYHPGRVAAVKIDNEIVGIVGELNPAIMARLGFRDQVRIGQFSFRLSSLVKAVEQELEFEPIPRYPSIIRDISILVDNNVTIGQVLNVVEMANTSNLIRDVDVFDIYEPDVVEADKEARPMSRKSIAFHVVYRADDRTLTDQDADVIERNIKQLLKEKLGAEVR